jgi:hypothetical protein
MPLAEPVRLFELLSGLLQTGAATQATVQQRLKPFANAAAPVQTRLGRAYLTLGGAFFQLTAIFEGPALHLYQVTLRVTPAAYAAIKSFARDLPGAAAPTLAGAAEWQNSWLGLLPRLRLRPAAGGKGVSARFVGLMPTKKVIVLTQL